MGGTPRRHVVSGRYRALPDVRFGMFRVRAWDGRHVYCRACLSIVSWAADNIFEQEIEMTRNMSVVLYIVVMIVVVVSVDLLFFRNLFWERLAANIGIILVFAVLYFSFRRKLKL